HLGVAFADLQLHRPKPALKQLDAAQKVLGKSHAWHLARAEGFRQDTDYAHCLYRMRHYAEAVAALNTAENLSPSDPAIYALMAQVHAKQGNREQALRDIESAERLGGNTVATLTATGDALLTLGDRNAAMQRFSRALDVPGGDRIGVRLAIAEIFLRQGHLDEAHRQIALGFAEARLDTDS